jgi:hypothetical protein
MTSYFVIDFDTWENGWYYDYKIKNAFPDLEPNRPYRCVSVVEGKVKNNLLRVIVNEITEESVYIPECYMTPLEKYRDNQIKQILK